MIRHTIALAGALTLAALALPTAASAQADPSMPAPPTPSPSMQTPGLPDPNAPVRDTVTIGLGGTLIPRYEGSGDYTVVPGGAVRGNYHGVGFSTFGTTLYVDLVPPLAQGTKFVFGPMAHVNVNRAALKQVRDPQIVALGKIPVSIDVGGHVGVSRTGVVTSAYDSLSLDIGVTHDVSGIHDSLIVTPLVTYGTPLNTKTYVGIYGSATHVGDGYARRYFGITPAQALASGLARYTPNSGFKDVTFGALANRSITGDLRHGLSAFGVGSYSRLLGQFARSPVVRDRSQFYAALGLAYTF